MASCQAFTSSARYLIAMFCAGGAIVCFLASHSRTDMQSVSITPSVFSFGDVRQGDRLTFTGTIRNTSSEVIVFTRTLSSCSCTTGGISHGQQLPPRKAHDFRVQWDVRDLRGAVKTTVVVEYCLAGQNRDNLTAGIAAANLVANVLPDYSIEPDQMVVDTKGDAITKLFTFRPHFPEVGLLDVISNHPALEPQIVRKDNDDATVSVYFDPAKYDSRLLVSTELRWKTTSVAAPKFTMPVIVQ